MAPIDHTAETGTDPEANVTERLRVDGEDFDWSEYDLSPETVRDWGPTPEIYCTESMADLRAHDSSFAHLFMPPTRAAMWDVLLGVEARPMTAREFCSKGARLSRSSFSRHKDAFLEWGVLLRAGTDDSGNSQYVLNVRHPLVQVLMMASNIAVHGQTRDLLEDEFVYESDSEKPLEAYAVTNADSTAVALTLCEKHDLNPKQWIDDEELAEYRDWRESGGS